MTSAAWSQQPAGVVCKLDARRICMACMPHAPPPFPGDGTSDAMHTPSFLPSFLNLRSGGAERLGRTLQATLTFRGPSASSRSRLSRNGDGCAGDSSQGGIVSIIRQTSSGTGTLRSPSCLSNVPRTLTACFLRAPEPLSTSVAFTLLRFPSFCVLV